LILFFVFWSPILFAQGSKGTTYRSEDPQSFKEINMGVWMGESWVSFTNDKMNGEWVRMNQLESKNADEIWVSFPDDFIFGEKGIYKIKFSKLGGKDAIKFYYPNSQNFDTFVFKE